MNHVINKGKTATTDIRILNLERQKQLIETHIRRLKQYEGFYLKKNGPYYTIVQFDGHVETQRYAGNFENKDVQNIAALRYLKKALPIIKKEIAYLTGQQNHGRGITPIEMRPHLSKAYRQQPRWIYEITAALKQHEWETKSWTISNKYPEEKRFTTIDGTAVRSKSEMLIADALAKHEIPYVYEGLHQLGGVYIAPDFTAFSVKKNTEVIWEHFGMMDVPSYADGTLDKIRLYLTEGYVSGVNLITTFEYANEGIDSRIIESLISTHF